METAAAAARRALVGQRLQALAAQGRLAAPLRRASPPVPPRPAGEALASGRRLLATAERALAPIAREPPPLLVRPARVSIDLGGPGRGAVVRVTNTGAAPLAVRAAVDPCVSCTPSADGPPLAPDAPPGPSPLRVVAGQAQTLVSGAAAEVSLAVDMAAVHALYERALAAQGPGGDDTLRLPFVHAGLVLSCPGLRVPVPVTLAPRPLARLLVAPTRPQAPLRLPLLADAQEPYDVPLLAASLNGRAGLLMLGGAGLSDGAGGGALPVSGWGVEFEDRPSTQPPQSALATVRVPPDRPVGGAREVRLSYTLGDPSAPTLARAFSRALALEVSPSTVTLRAPGVQGGVCQTLGRCADTRGRALLLPAVPSSEDGARMAARLEILVSGPPAVLVLRPRAFHLGLLGGWEEGEKGAGAGEETLAFAGEGGGAFFSRVASVEPVGEAPGCAPWPGLLCARHGGTVLVVEDVGAYGYSCPAYLERCGVQGAGCGAERAYLATLEVRREGECGPLPDALLERVETGLGLPGLRHGRHGLEALVPLDVLATALRYSAALASYYEAVAADPGAAAPRLAELVGRLAGDVEAGEGGDVSFLSRVLVLAGSPRAPALPGPLPGVPGGASGPFTPLSRRAASGGAGAWSPLRFLGPPLDAQPHGGLSRGTPDQASQRPSPGETGSVSGGAPQTPSPRDEGADSPGGLPEPSSPRADGECFAGDAEALLVPHPAGPCPVSVVHGEGRVRWVQPPAPLEALRLPVHPLGTRAGRTLLLQNDGDRPLLARLALRRVRLAPNSLAALRQNAARPPDALVHAALASTRGDDRLAAAPPVLLSFPLVGVEAGWGEGAASPLRLDIGHATHSGEEGEETSPVVVDNRLFCSDTLPFTLRSSEVLLAPHQRAHVGVSAEGPGLGSLEAMRESPLDFVHNVCLLVLSTAPVPEGGEGAPTRPGLYLLEDVASVPKVVHKCRASGRAGARALLLRNIGEAPVSLCVVVGGRRRGVSLARGEESIVDVGELAGRGGAAPVEVYLCDLALDPVRRVAVYE